MPASPWGNFADLQSFFHVLGHNRSNVINIQKTLDQFPFHDGERQVFQLTLLRPTVNEALTILITLSGERERNIPRTTLKQLEVVLRTHRSADSRPFFKRAHYLNEQDKDTRIANP